MAWLMTRKTVGVIGAGRIGAAYAKMMVEGFKMDFLYYDLYQNKALEDYLTAYCEFLKSQGEEPISWRKCDSTEEVLRESDVVSLHPVLRLVGRDSACHENRPQTKDRRLGCR